MEMSKNKKHVKKIRKRAGRTFWAHTGTINACWGMLKDNVPSELPICKQNQSRLNSLLWKYARTWQWQWRWEANVVGSALLKKRESA